MYALELMNWLHQRLGNVDEYQQSVARFEQLRGYGLLPRGSENAGVRLSDSQIANAILGFCHPKAGFAGHAALIWGDLRQVGGSTEPFENCQNLNAVVSKLFSSIDKSKKLVRLTVSVAQDFGSDQYNARLYYKTSEKHFCISFVSKHATSLLGEGKDIGFEHEKIDCLTAWERSFGSEFFRSLSQSVQFSRQINLPLKTDWQEYKNEEDRAAFNEKLGAHQSSNFLNLRVDANVAWPKEPTRIKFANYHFILFPRTKDHSHSISIDLHNERISADEARTLMSRLLSLLSWCENQASSVHEGWSGGQTPSPIRKLNMGGTTMDGWLFGRTLPENDDLLRCLAYFRDGLNAYSVGLASHAVLSFYRVVEVKNDEDRKVRTWIKNNFDKFQSHIGREDFERYDADRHVTGKGHVEYIYENLRVATAHGAKKVKSDPDKAEETRRLLAASSILLVMARYHIVTEYGYSTSFLADREVTSPQNIAEEM